MAKKQYFITRCADYNGYKDVLFLMEADDVEFRNNLNCHSDNPYIIEEPVKSVKRMPKGTRDSVGRSYKLATSESGRRFHVFSDYSMKEAA